MVSSPTPSQMPATHRAASTPLTKSPPLFTTGESFDVACFGGPTCYHATRVEGVVSPTVLSSVHVRCVDMEMGCQPENPSDKSLFEKNTRAASKSLMVYTASIDSAWSALPNHERIADDSFHVLQVLCSSIGPLSIARSIARSIAISTLPAHLCCR